MLWANNVLPSSLPFFICINLLKNTSFIKIIGKILTPLMKPFFGVPGSGAFALAMGISSGYPTGAKISSELYLSEDLNKTEAERLLAFTNTSGPLFIVSAVGTSMFQNQQIGLLLLITHFLGSLTVGLLFKNYYKSDKNSSSGIISQNNEKRKETSKITDFKANSTINSKNIGYYVGNAIHNSISTLLLIGGYIVIFSVLGNILEELHVFSLFSTLLTPLFELLKLPTDTIIPILKGFLEVTCGLMDLSQIIGIETIILTISAFVLGFGGICVLMQVASIISNTDLSLKPYIIGKLMHGAFSALYTFLILKYTNFFSLQLVSAFSYSTSANIVAYETSNMMSGISSLLLISIIVKFFFNCKKSYSTK